MNKSVAQFDSKKSVVILVVAVVLVGIVVAIAAMIQQSDSKINSFQACADAGYPISQSFPETCSVPDGKSFTNN